jgi:hypothetical protein
MFNTYILDNRIPVKCNDPALWATWMGTADRCVIHDQIDEMKVCTDFLGMDHNFRDRNKPLLFETMVFGNQLPDLEGIQLRYSTYAEAEAGHHVICQLVRMEKQLVLKAEP